MKATDITVKIPIELTQAMILRVGVIKSEATALELAEELHEIVADAVAAYCGESGAAPRDITPLDLADFQLACWRHIFIEDAPFASKSDAVAKASQGANAGREEIVGHGIPGGAR